MTGTNFFLIEMTTVGIIIGFIFFLIAAGIAFVTYKMLKKTVTMAIRMAIVAAILLISLIISIGLLTFVSGKKKPAPTKTPSTSQKPNR
jgi:hypothetical protein